MPGRNYRDLIAWQKAMDLVEAVYQATARFPRKEVYGLSSQLRRTSVSVASNIAEGQDRSSVREFAYYLSVAYGSLRELETQVLIAGRLRYLNPGEILPIMSLASEVGRLINGLSRSLLNR